MLFLPPADGTELYHGAQGGTEIGLSEKTGDGYAKTHTNTSFGPVCFSIAYLFRKCKSPHGTISDKKCFFREVDPLCRSAHKKQRPRRRRSAGSFAKSCFFVSVRSLNHPTVRYLPPERFRLRRRSHIRIHMRRGRIPDRRPISRRPVPVWFC